MFSLFKKKSKTNIQMIYVRNNIPFDDLDLVKLILILSTCSTCIMETSLPPEPFITTWQYDRVVKHKLGKYFTPKTFLLNQKTDIV